MKTILKLILVLFITTAWANGQENSDQVKIKDKKKLELRPNSREYGAVKRDNFHKRIDRKHNKVVYQKKKAILQQKRAMLKKNNARIKREQVIKRRQTIIQQRRSLRK